MTSQREESIITRHPRDVRLRGDEVEEADHVRLGVEEPFIHVHVDRLGAVLDLAPGYAEGGLEVVLPDEAREAGRAGDVGALADVDEERIGGDVQGLEPGEPGDRGVLGRNPGGDSRHRLDERPDVVGSRAAASADDVDEAALRPVADLAGELVRGEVVAAELVREPGVRVRAHRGRRDPRELLDPRPDLERPEGAVEPRRERRGVPDRVPERLDGLPREGAAGGVRDGPGDDDRKAPPERLEGGFEGEDRGLRVQRVEDRLDEDEVDPARDEGAGRLLVGGAKLVEARVAGARVLHRGGDGRGPVGGSEHAGRETGTVRLRPRGGAGAGDASPRLVDLGRKIGRVVVSLRDRGGAERVGEDDVAPRREVGVVDLRHHVGPGEAKEVVVAAKRAGGVPKTLSAIVRLVEPALLEHGPGGAVEHDDALAKERIQETVHFSLPVTGGGEARARPGGGAQVKCRDYLTRRDSPGRGGASRLANRRADCRCTAVEGRTSTWSGTRSGRTRGIRDPPLLRSERLDRFHARPESGPRRFGDRRVRGTPAFPAPTRISLRLLGSRTRICSL